MDPLEGSVSDVLRATGRQSPELGGGAASILSALIGMSLIRMAAATTAHKSGADLPMDLQPIDDVSGRLEELARADVEVFRQYVLALKLPRETEHQEAARDVVLDQTGQQAAQTPLEAAAHITEGLEIAVDIAPHIRAEVSSDIYAGAAILNGAFFGALATLDINLKPQRMADQRDTLLAQKEEVLRRQKAAMAEISRQAAQAGYLMP
jgi:formiminotetrahydrofolate cyclodeaminase